MKKKGMLIFTFLMLLCNTLTMYYVNRALKQEINIYVVQVGRYKEKANAENIIVFNVIFTFLFFTLELLHNQNIKKINYQQLLTVTLLIILHL